MDDNDDDDNDDADIVFMWRLMFHRVHIAAKIIPPCGPIKLCSIVFDCIVIRVIKIHCKNLTDSSSSEKTSTEIRLSLSKVGIGPGVREKPHSHSSFSKHLLHQQYYIMYTFVNV